MPTTTTTTTTTTMTTMTLIVRTAVAGLFAVLSCARVAETPAQAGIALEPCLAGSGPGSIAALCGKVSVPENRSRPGGRLIEIHFAVIRGGSQTQNAFLMIAGGPGQSSMLFGSARWYRPLQAAMDVLLVDQRGTGASHPLPCDLDVVQAPAHAFGHVIDPARVRRCRAALDSIADLTQYTTDAAAEDIEAVRAALGYERLAVYGGSYGTRLAQAYVRRHPDRVKAAVLDGVVPVNVAMPLEYAASGQHALDRVFASCLERINCREARPAPAEDFKRLLETFDAGPRPATIRTPTGLDVHVMMSRGDFVYAVRGILYSAPGGATIPDLVGRALANGDVSAFAQRYWDRARGFTHDFSDPLHWSVFCSEDIPFVTEQEISTATANTFMGRYLFDEYRNACAEWPRGRIREDFRTPVAVRVPTLLVSGALDPVTPPELAETVRRSLPLAVHIVSPNTAHGSVPGCALPAVLQFLSTGTLTDLPHVCD